MYDVAQTGPEVYARMHRRTGPLGGRSLDGGSAPSLKWVPKINNLERGIMNRLIYIVGLVVVIVAVLSFFGLR